MPARYRVVVVGGLDVIVDPDPLHVPFNVFVALLRQCGHDRLVYFCEGMGPGCRRPFEGQLVRVGHRRLQQSVYFVEAKEALVVQLRERVFPPACRSRP